MLVETPPQDTPATAASVATIAPAATPAAARARSKQDVPVLGRAGQNFGRNWVTTGFMLAFHVGAVAALFFFSWTALISAVVLYILSINVGIGMCYHRLLTHRGYKVPKWLEYAMTVCATLSLEGGPIFWVATHRVHHQLSDHEGDPHTPHDGGWWAHVDWILERRRAPSRNRAALALCSRPRKGSGASHAQPLSLGSPCDCWPCCCWPSAAGPAVLWGIFLRVTLGLHSTWLVNSATHMWGSRRFETRDESRNLWWVALLTGGEGWHNNHHAHPVSARHGLAWYEIDPNYYGIWILKKLGLAKQIKIAQYDPANPRPAGAA